MSMGYRHRRVIFVVLLFGVGAMLLLMRHRALSRSVLEVFDVIPQKVVDNHDSVGADQQQHGRKHECTVGTGRLTSAETGQPGDWSGQRLIQVGCDCRAVCHLRPKSRALWGVSRHRFPALARNRRIMASSASVALPLVCYPSTNFRVTNVL